MLCLVIYLGILLGFLILGILSRNEKTLSKRPVHGMVRVIRKTAVYLYRKWRRYGQKTLRHRRDSPEKELVERELSVLYAPVRLRTETARYYIDKLQSCLLFLLIADVLAVFLWISDGQASLISPEGSIERPSYTEPEKKVTAQASSRTGDGKEIVLGEYELSVRSQKYTEEETQKLADRLFPVLPDKILADNRSLNYVTGNLDLISAADGYPFRITWDSSNYELLDTDGAVHTEKMEKDEHGRVTLTAQLSYEGWKESKSYDVLIFRKPESKEEKLQEAIRRELDQEEAKEKEVFVLPSAVEGVPLLWKEKKENRSLILFGLLTAAGILSFFGKDQELHQKIQKRERQLCLDYPMVISKMTLFLGAGISMRNVFYRLGEEYQKKREREGGEPRYAYEEILIVCRELDNGILETEAYANFGKRCRSRQYSKLSTLLTSNLKKGNGELLKALQEEADRSFEERKNLARQLGEEAGTRLLLPMVIMLGITLVIIMIPAYYGFSW